MPSPTDDGNVLAVPTSPVVTEAALMAAIVDSGFFSMVAIDLEGTIVHWNRAAERLFGWRRIEAVGRSIDLIVPADRRDELAAMIATLRRGDEVLPIETVRRTKTGNDVCVCLQVSPVLDASGRLIGASKFGFDYTDQAATRAELAASEARYHALVDALSEFVVVTNADGEVVRPQSSWAAFTGQDDSTAGGRGWFDAVHPHDRTAFEGQWVQGAAVAEPFSLAGRLLHRGGEYRHCEGRVAPRRDALGRVVEWVAAFADVHERHLAQERERNTAERFRRIFAANVFGVCYGEHRSILDANAMMLDMLGVRRKELAAGIPWDDVIVSDAADPVDFGNGAAREFEVRRSDGSTAYLLAAGVSLAPDRGWLAVAVDVTQRKAAERETEHRALHDPLTGLANRQLLVDRLEHALSRARRQGSLVGVLFCDLDHFKEINDAYGHAVGDLALQTVARRLESLMRDSDTVARIGGDEFVIVLEDLADPGDAARISERIRAELSTPVTLEAHDITLSASIGVALNTDNDDRVETLLGRADNAMYRNKRHSQDQITLEPDHTDSPRCQASSRHEHAPALALADNTLDLETTPPIDLRACGAAGP